MPSNLRCHRDCKRALVQSDMDIWTRSARNINIIFTASLTKSGLPHLPVCVLEYIHIHSLHHQTATPLHLRNLPDPPQRSCNNRPSPPTRRRRLPRGPLALRRLYILHRALLRLFNKPFALESRSRQPRRVARQHRTPNPALLHVWRD